MSIILSLLLLWLIVGRWTQTSKPMLLKLIDEKETKKQKKNILLTILPKKGFLSELNEYVEEVAHPCHIPLSGTRSVPTRAQFPHDQFPLESILTHTNSNP